MNSIVLNSSMSQNSNSISSNSIESTWTHPNQTVNKSEASDTSLGNLKSNNSFYDIEDKSIKSNLTGDSQLASHFTNLHSKKIAFNDVVSVNTPITNHTYKNNTIKSTNTSELKSTAANSYFAFNNSRYTPSSAQFSTFDSQISTVKPLCCDSNNNAYEHLQNKVIIDVAVLCQEYTNIDKMETDNVINLDDIPISVELFKKIFYPYGENFGFNKDYISKTKEIFKYITFLPEYRCVNHKKFYLLEEIISNIENNLNISRNCFTKESLVELTGEITNIKALYDINCCSVLASLTWENIKDIIKNYRLNNHCQCNNNNNELCLTTKQYLCTECNTEIKPVIPICVVNIVFKTPTPGVTDTIIRFNYRLTNI